MSKKTPGRGPKRKKDLPPGTLIYTGTRTANPPTVLTQWLDEASFLVHTGYDRHLAQRPGGLRWIDVRGLSDEILIKEVGDEFKVHYLALEDVLDTQQRAKLEEYDDSLFFILPNLRLDAETLTLSSEQIALYLGPGYLLSFQEDADDTFASVRRRAEEGAGRLRKRGPDYLAYALVDVVVDNYYLLLDEFEAVLLRLEADMARAGAVPENKERIFDLKRLLNDFRHRILPLREAVTRFYRTDSALVEDQNRLYFRDVVDHLAQIFDSVDRYRDMLGNLDALYQAELSNRLNNVMRLLTVISTIFIPLSFIASLYGMNFDYMPELHSRYGYYTVLGVMAVAMIGMLIYFRRKRWI